MIIKIKPIHCYSLFGSIKSSGDIIITVSQGSRIKPLLVLFIPLFLFVRFLIARKYYNFTHSSFSIFYNRQGGALPKEKRSSK
jgi:hypothetical protein